jgi:hypothetical protein
MFGPSVAANTDPLFSASCPHPTVLFLDSPSAAIEKLELQRPIAGSLDVEGTILLDGRGAQNARCSIVANRV